MANAILGKILRLGKPTNRHPMPVIVQPDVLASGLGEIHFEQHLDLATRSEPLHAPQHGHGLGHTQTTLGAPNLAGVQITASTTAINAMPIIAAKQTPITTS